MNKREILNEYNNVRDSIAKIGSFVDNLKFITKARLSKATTKEDKNNIMKDFYEQLETFKKNKDITKQYKQLKQKQKSLEILLIGEELHQSSNNETSENTESEEINHEELNNKLKNILNSLQTNNKETNKEIIKNNAPLTEVNYSINLDKLSNLAKTLKLN